jgi:hypothetical protein
MVVWVAMVLKGRDGMLLLLHVIVEQGSHPGQRPVACCHGLWWSGGCLGLRGREGLLLHMLVKRRSHLASPGWTAACSTLSWPMSSSGWLGLRGREVLLLLLLLLLPS